MIPFMEEATRDQSAFLRLPRELRCMIYQELLDDNCEPEPFALERVLDGCCVTEIPKRQRNASVGYYVPFFCRLKDSKSAYSNNSSTLYDNPIINEMPILCVCKEVRAEVLEFFNIGLDVFAKPGWQALEKWGGRLSEDWLAKVRQINLFLSVGVHVMSEEEGVQNKSVEDVDTRRFPILRLETDSLRRTLTVKSCVRFIDTHTAMLQGAVHAYTEALPSSHRFTGRDLINIAVLLSGLEKEILKLDGAAWRNHKIAQGIDPGDFGIYPDDL